MTLLVPFPVVTEKLRNEPWWSSAPTARLILSEYAKFVVAQLRMRQALVDGVDVAANPLGARALYLYQDDRDILFRIHGTNEPWSIGQAVSSGCVRMLNEDIHDLYNRVPVGATVMVRRGGSWRV